MAAMPVEVFADARLADQSHVLCIVGLVTKDLLYQLPSILLCSLWLE